MKNSRRDFIRIISCSSLGLSNLPLHSFGYNTPQKESLKINPDYSFYNLFQKPPNTAKPFVRWWWNGNLIEKKEVIRQLDIMKNAGIGGVEINPISFPEEDDLGIKTLTWLSEEWIEMVKFTVKEAHNRGIICDIIVGSGWPFGGEFLEKDEQTQVLVMDVNRYKLVGPASVRFSKQQLINRVGSQDLGDRELYAVRMVPSYMENFEEGVDLTDQFEDEILNIDVPYYVDQELYVLVKLTGRQTVTRGAPGASGPVLNHYNKSAVAKYLNRMSDALNPQLNGMDSAFRSMFCDSLELSGNTWCHDMLDEFQKRRGYSLKPYIPFVLSYNGHMGNPVGTKMTGSALEEVNRVRYDYNITKIELFTERFLKTYHEWCKANGVKSRVQTYGVGYHSLESCMIVDIPECETWLGDHNGLKDHLGFTTVNKFIASGSRLAGKKLVSCEEITNISQVFFASLEMIKINGDQSNLSGVNHSVLHGYNYSPSEAEFPGWIQWGAFFSERNTWWPYFKYWADYKARISSIFQMSDPRADIALMHPLADKWSKYGQQFQPAFGWGERYPWYEYDLWYAIHQNGNTCDYISEKIINEGEMNEGVLKYNARTYHTIMLMEVSSIHSTTAKELAQFVEKGGKLIFIGNAPTKSPGLKNYEKDDLLVKKTIEKITNEYSDNCKVVHKPEKDLLKWFQQIQKECKIAPSVMIYHPNRDISQVQYTYEDKEIYFFTNSNRKKRHNFQAVFNTGEKIPWLWDTETGDRYLYPYNEQKNSLNIELLPAESKLIVFDNHSNGKPMPSRIIDQSSTFNIEGPWEVLFTHIDDTQKRKTLDKLVDFKDIPEFKAFAGTALYTKTLRLDPNNSYSYLVLGEVHGISEVSINGTSLGAKWYGEHLYDGKNLLKNNSITIQIKITTIVGNYCKSLTENSTAQRWTRNQGFDSLGLVGPVRLCKKG